MESSGTQTTAPPAAPPTEPPKKKRRGCLWTILAAVLALLVIVIATPGDNEKTVALTLVAERAGGAVIFEGTTDLPDGALIAYEVSRDYGDEEWPANPWATEGTVAVKRGAYRGRVENAPEGTIKVWVAFQTILGAETQPADVLETFGEMGEHLTGENVTEAGGLKRVELTATVD